MNVDDLCYCGDDDYDDDGAKYNDFCHTVEL